ncbi:phage tail tape measure protein [Desulfurobacterium sp.]
MKEAFNVLAVFDVIDNLTKPIDEMQKAMSEFQKSIEKVREGLDKIQDAGKKMAAMGAAITAPFAGAAYAAIDFEKTVVGEFNKVANLPRKQLAGFRKFFMDLSQQIPLSANEIAKLSANLAQMGVPTDQLKQFTEMVSKAAFAFDMVADEAGRAFGEIRSAFGIKSIKDLQAVGDTINYLSNTMGADAEQIVDILRRTGASAKQFGMDAKNVAVLGAILKEQGFASEVVGTALSTAFQRLQIMNRQARDALETIGMSAYEFDELRRRSPEKAFITLLERIKELDKATQSQVIYKLFGLEHSGKIAGFLNNLDRLKEKLNEIRAGKYTGSMDAELKSLMQTTYAQFRLLKNQLQNLGIVIGSLLIPPLKAFVTALTSALKPITDFIQAHQTLAKVLVYPVVGIGLLLTALGSLAMTIGFVGQGILNFIGFIPALVSGFTTAASAVLSFGASLATTLVSGLTAATAAVWSFTTALLANPITWVVAGIAGLAAAGYYLYKNWDTVSQHIKGIWQRVKEFLGSIFEGIKVIFQGAISFFSTAWQKFISIFLWTNPITAPIMALKKLYSFAGSINLFDAGKQIIEGLYKGLVSMAKKPLEAIENIGHSIKDRFKALLGISSPSRLFMQFGHFLNEGLGLGMLKSIDVVQDAVKRIASVLNLPEDKRLKIALETAVKGGLPVAAGMLAAGIPTPAVGNDHLPHIKVTVTISNLVVGDKKDAPVVAREITGLTRSELERMLKEIYEQQQRKRY